jgi:hypothetical protein
MNDRIDQCDRDDGIFDEGTPPLTEGDLEVITLNLYIRGMYTGRMKTIWSKQVGGRINEVVSLQVPDIQLNTSLRTLLVDLDRTKTHDHQVCRNQLLLHDKCSNNCYQG